MKKYEKYEGKEREFQISCARYLDVLGVLWNHCPNGGKRNIWEAAYLKKQGVKSGYPDICILEPNKLYHGLFIELKVGYNKMSENQERWLFELHKRGYKTLCTHSLDEFIETVDNYLKIN